MSDGRPLRSQVGRLGDKAVSDLKFRVGRPAPSGHLGWNQAGSVAFHARPSMSLESALVRKCVAGLRALPLCCGVPHP